MKKLSHKILLAALVIPLDMNQWIETSFPFKWEPDFKTSNGVLTIESDDDLGGYAYVIKKEQRSQKLNLHWQWKVDQFPKPLASFPYQKKDDDYPIRLGLLVNDFGEPMDLPSVVKKRLKKNKTQVTHYVFYVPMPKTVLKEKRCGQSPFSDRGLICQVPTVKGKWEKNNLQPHEDFKKAFKKEKFEFNGLWIFSDTDQTESKSKIHVKDLRLIKKQ